MPTPSRTSRGALRAGTALALALAGGCNSVGAREYNLDQLHTDDGFHRFSATLMDGVEFAVRSGLGRLVPGSKISLNEKEPSKVDDPLEECLDNLEQLEKASSSDPDRASVKVQVFARFAVECPWQLSRERCVRALGAEGERLGMRDRPPPLLEGEAVGPEELGDGLARLLTAVRPGLTGDGEIDPSAVGEACALVGGFAYDREGVRRALAFVSVLARDLPGRDEVFEPVRRLHLDLQGIAVHRALAWALKDRAPFERTGSDSGWESGRVRGAAVEACVRAFGPQALAEFLAQLDPREDPQVMLALLRGVRAYGGLPLKESGLPPGDRLAWQERWIDMVVALASSHPDSRVRVTAMQALAPISGGALTSLREEDWMSWLAERRALQRGADEPVAPGGGR